ncbi:DNA polymerase III subunit beta [Alkaliphilus peptidifermentans]|uniref:Beta sliding clamp n=1 Tax=Alkaliphilus peptidifermentans DSM 18978 TaxID=1120976 RepID=A0A1G5HGJ2_9FIRM|nr:DNA polymerase III subunit beta [Alkaliphilus peptidifermentans]SCY62982.1 DNA polymerase III, beta subunit [Alkaliphilus peptidifermentans DSM 18978]
MHIICPQKSLLNSINIVQKSVSTKTTLPILRGIYIEAASNQLKIVGTDLEIGIENLIEAEILDEGATVIDARLFSDIIRKLPDADIDIKLIDNNQVNIKCLNAEFSIVCHNPDDFPDLPEISEDNFYKIPQELFRNMIKQTVFATSQDESRPILTGVLLEIDQNSLNMVALDGYRLALRKGKIQSDISNKAVIPARTLSEVARILEVDNEKPIEICLTENHALFITGKTKLISRLLEGEFINYKQILPKEYKSRVKINTRNLYNSIERASLLAREGKNNLVKLIINDDKMIITSNSELGKVHEEIVILLEGDDIEIAFNSKYFMDALKVFDDEEIYLDFTTNISPGIMKPVDNENYTYLVLPVRVSSN